MKQSKGMLIAALLLASCTSAAPGLNAVSSIEKKEEKSMNNAETTIRIGLYKHYKGNMYHVLGIARHSESHEILVIYQMLYGSYGYWVRPLTMFTGAVMHEGKSVPRFSFVSENVTVPAPLR